MTKAERIKKLREEKCLTQEELAQRLKTTKQTIHKYEKGIVTNIPSDRIEALAKILGTTPEYILGWENAEERIEMQKKNDTIADVIVRLRADADFLSLVETLNQLDQDKILGVKQMLAAFLK